MEVGIAKLGVLRVSGLDIVDAAVLITGRLAETVELLMLDEIRKVPDRAAFDALADDAPEKEIERDDDAEDAAIVPMIVDDRAPNEVEEVIFDGADSEALDEG